MVKRMLGLAVVLASVVSLFGSGCSVLQQAGSTGGGESYFPHAQGNSWVMTGSDGGTETMTVEGTINVGGSNTAQKFCSCYMQNIGASAYTSTGETYYQINGTGAYYWGNSGYVFPAAYTMFPFSLEVGKSWDMIASGSPTVKGIVVARENVAVPAGTFDCYKLALVATYVLPGGTSETETEYYWLGDNAGFVKLASSSSTVETVLTWKNF